MKVRLFLFVIALAACTESKEVKLQRFLLKGNIALSEKNEEQATNYFQEAIRIDPCFADALNNLGTIQFRHNDLEAALGFYDQAIACKPGFLPALFNRANVYYELKQYFSAIEDIGKVIQQKPDTAAAYFLQGLVATRMRDYQLAFTAFDKAVTLDSSNVDYRVNHGTINYYLHRYDEAKNDLAIAAKLNPGEPNIYNTLSLIAISENQAAVALEQIEKALRLAPDEPYFINNRGYILLMQNKPKEAILDIDKSIVLDSENGWAYRNKGIYYLLSGDFSNALRLLKQGYDMDPFIDKIHFYLGTAYLKNGNMELACEEFKKSDQVGDKMTTTDILKTCK